jgi:hypothetical protein
MRTIAACDADGDEGQNSPRWLALGLGCGGGSRREAAGGGGRREAARGEAAAQGEV